MLRGYQVFLVLLVDDLKRFSVLASLDISFFFSMQPTQSINSTPNETSTSPRISTLMHQDAGTGEHQREAFSPCTDNKSSAQNGRIIMHDAMGYLIWRSLVCSLHFFLLHT